MSLADEPAITSRDRFLALSIILIWASNFIALRLGLDIMSPLALCTWRFLLSFFPACLLVPRPAARWRLILAFGLITGIGQFGALAVAIQGHVSAGLASALVQVQAVINVALAGWWLREPIRRAQIAGCLVSLTGLAIFLVRPDSNATLLGVVLVLVAAFSWATCNVLMKAGGYSGDLLSFLVWTSPIAFVSLAVLSFLFEGSRGLVTPLANPSINLWAILAWQAFANTLFGYSVWNLLIRRYSLSRIGPLTLLVPVIAMSMTAALLDERVRPVQGIAALLIMAGVAVPFIAHGRRKRTSDK